LEKVVVIDKVEILESGHIQVRQATKIMEDNVELARTFHRHVLSPGDLLEGQDPKVQAVATVVWTDEVVKAYQEKGEAK